MDELFKPIVDKFKAMLMAAVNEVTQFFDIENALPLILTAEQCKKLLGISNHTEFQRITHLPDFPKIDKGRGSHIRYPRDAVRDWVNTHWQDIA